MLAPVSFRSRLAVTAATAALAAASGTAYAAGLPAAASSTAQGVLQSLGVTTGGSVPKTSQPSGTHGAEVSSVAQTTTATGAAKGVAVAAVASDGRSHAGDDHTSEERGGAGSEKGSTHGHGAEISTLAHSTIGTAGAKGATISAAASGGKSHAGEHGHKGKNGGTHGNAPTRSHGGGNGNGGGHGPGKGPGGS